MTTSGDAAASHDHLAVEKVDPFTASPVEGGARKPVPAGRSGKSLRGKAYVTKATLA